MAQAIVCRQENLTVGVALLTHTLASGKEAKDACQILSVLTLVKKKFWDIKQDFVQYK